MPAIATSALVSLAAVLLLSGAAKLLAPSTGRTILDTVPLPGALRAPWVQRALPWCEVLLAAALCVSAGPLLTVAAGLATVLFAAFAVVVHRGTRAPDPASCGCFGELSRAAVSRRTVVRNAAFTLTAALALVLTLTGFHGPALELPWWGAVAAGIPLALVLLTLWSLLGGALPLFAPVVAAVVARTLLLLPMNTYPAARPGSLGAQSRSATQSRQGHWMIAVLLALPTLLFPGAWLAWLVGLVTVLVTARFAASRLGGGLTGDSYGFIITITEIAVLCAHAWGRHA